MRSTVTDLLSRFGRKVKKVTILCNFFIFLPNLLSRPVTVDHEINCDRSTKQIWQKSENKYSRFLGRVFPYFWAVLGGPPETLLETFWAFLNEWHSCWPVDPRLSLESAYSTFLIKWDPIFVSGWRKLWEFLWKSYFIESSKIIQKNGSLSKKFPFWTNLERF